MQRDISGFDNLFELFMIKNFDFRLVDLSPEIAFVAPFTTLRINYELPFAAQKNRDQVLHVSSFFLGFRTLRSKFSFYTNEQDSKAISDTV